MLQTKILTYELLDQTDNWTFMFLDAISRQSNPFKNQSVIKESIVPYLSDKVTIKLTDVVEINPDKVSKEIRNTNDVFGYIDISSISSETGLIYKIKTLQAQDLPARARFKVRKGDILLSTVRPGNNIVAIVPSKYDGFIVNSTLAVLRPKSHITSEVLYFLLKSELIQQLLIIKARGTTIPTVSLKELKTLEIPVSMSKLKHGQELAKHLYKEWIDNNNQKKSLQDLVEDTFKKHNIVSDKLNSQVEKFIYKNYPYNLLQDRLDVGFYFYELDNTLSTFTNQVKLKKVIKNIKSGATGVSTDNFCENGVPLIRIKDLNNEELFIQSENTIYINKELSEKYSQNAVLANDILVSKVGTVGKTALVDTSMEGAIINQHLAAIEVNDLILPEYLICYLKTSWAKHEFERRSGGAAQQFIKIEDIEDIPVPLPALHIQKEIVEYVKHQSSDDKIERLKLDIQDLTRSITSS